MKVILLKDVQKLGKKYDVKEVNQGYGMNYLVKNGLAKVATKHEEEKVLSLKQAEKAKEDMNEKLIEKVLKSIDGKEITIKSKVNEKGHLFKALNEKDVATEVGKQLNIDIDSKWIVLDKPIKEATKFNIPVKRGEHKGTIILNVEKE